MELLADFLDSDADVIISGRISYQQNPHSVASRI